MISQQKIEKLSKNLLPLIESDDPGTIYQELLNLRWRYKEYFQKMDGNDFMRLVFHVISLKQTGNFELADRITDVIKFIGIVSTEGNHHVEECEDCSGGGYIPCEYCTDGRVDCDECNGDGEINCDECDGSGKVGEDEEEECDNCGGSGEIHCPECAGDGYNTCPECSGNEQINCSECDGTGEIVSDDQVDYKTQVYCSWNKDLNNLCEIRLNSSDGIDQEYFSKYENKDCFLLGSNEDQWGVPEGFVDSDVNYVVYYDDILPRNSLIPSDRLFRVYYDASEYFN